MQFTQTAAVPQLYRPQGAAASGPALYLLLPQTTASPPATLGLGASWTAYPAGAYLFLPAPVPAGGESAFARAAWAFLGDPGLKAVRFAWLTGHLPLSGRLSGATAAVWQPGAGAWATSRGTGFEFRDLTLFLAPGAPVVAHDAEGTFTFGAAGAPPARLIAGWGATSLPAIAGGPLTLPVTGARAGCLCFPATLAMTGGAADVDTLDVGFRVFHGDPVLAHDGAFFMRSLRWRMLATEAQALPLYAALDPLAPLDGARTFLAFAPGDAGLAGPSAISVPSYFRTTLGEPLALRPQTGSAAPTGFARLAFAERPAPSPAGPSEPLCLVPRGDFEVTGGADLLGGVSGVEFVEWGAGGNLLSFSPGGPAYAAGFYPGEPAGTVRLEPAGPGPTTAYAGPSRRGDTADYFAQPDASVLFNYPPRQPADVTTVPELAPRQVLAASLVHPPTAWIPLLPYAGAGPEAELPAYAQVEAEVVNPLRRGLLAGHPPQARPTGSSLLDGAATGPASQYSSTPQGLLATYVPASPTWDEVVLAQMAATGDQLRFDGVTGDLLSAFRRNQLFLVATSPGALRGVLPPDASTVQIGADPAQLWSFSLDPDDWAAYGTVLVLKYAGKSIRELLGQRGAWAYPGTFNTDADAAAQALIDAIDGADPDDPHLAGFVAAARDPAWNGILALNVRAPLDELPAQLAGLAAGIDPAAFFAHHLGITASRVVVPATPGDLSITDPCIFGLLDYHAAGPLVPSDADYRFQVQQLTVLFRNSAVAAFASIVELEINALFAEPATLRGEGANLVEMYGVYQTHQSNGQTRDAYVFQTPNGVASVFGLAGGVIGAVQLSGGDFATIAPQRPFTKLAETGGAVRASGTLTLTTTGAHDLAVGDRVKVSHVADDAFNGVFTVATVPSPTKLTVAQAGADATAEGGRVAPTLVRSRFAFRGVIDFNALAGFDLFSFGSPPSEPVDPDEGEEGDEEAVEPPPPVGLQFANLAIGMDFDRGGEPIVPVFAFDARALSVDPARSTSRPASFFGHFPLKVAAVTQGAAGSTPAGEGFLGVQTPLPPGQLRSPWFALLYTVDLGSPGGLAAQAGFGATLVAAWSPADEEEGPALYVGMRLSGPRLGLEARGFQLQGVFEVEYRSMRIMPVPGGDTWMLVLYGAGFEFLGFPFPPVGQIDFVLFGNPAEGGAGKALGWYAAYAPPPTL